MAVMAACVHGTVIDAGVLEPGLLDDGESIHVGAEQDRLSGTAAPDGARDAEAVPCRDLPAFDAHGLKLGRDLVAGLDLPETQFRVAVEIPAHFDQVVLIFFSNHFQIC